MTVTSVLLRESVTWAVGAPAYQDPWRKTGGNGPWKQNPHSPLSTAWFPCQRQTEKVSPQSGREDVARPWIKRGKSFVSPNCQHRPPLMYILLSLLVVILSSGYSQLNELLYYQNKNNLIHTHTIYSILLLSSLWVRHYCYQFRIFISGLDRPIGNCQKEQGQIFPESLYLYLLQMVINLKHR